MRRAVVRLKRVALAIWHGWLWFAELFGKLMFFLIMTVLYFTLVTLIAIPHRLLSDPLQLRDRGTSTWHLRPESASDRSSMQRQS